MSLDAHLRHTCEIERDTVTDEDPYGGPGTTVTITAYSGICRYVERTEKVGSSDRGQAEIATHYQLVLPANADVHELDRIKRIVVDGETLTTGYTIRAVLARRKSVRHHLTVELERLG